MTDAEPSNGDRHAAADALWAFRRDALPDHPRRAGAGRPGPPQEPCPGRRTRDWAPWSGRRDPIDVLEAQGDSRAPELVPIRYGRMAASPFAFFRGGAAIMAMDLATTPVTGLRVQACGDAHVANFGKFATPERNVMFDINDFDETLPGPVGVGRQAAVRQPARRRPGPRLLAGRVRRGRRAPRRAPTASGSPRSSVDAHARPLVRPHPRRSTSSTTSRRSTGPSVKRDVAQGAAQGPRPGRRQADRRRSTGGSSSPRTRRCSCTSRTPARTSPRTSCP